MLVVELVGAAVVELVGAGALVGVEVVVDRVEVVEQSNSMSQRKETIWASAGPLAYDGKAVSRDSDKS